MLFYINNLCRREFQTGTEDRSGIHTLIVLEYLLRTERVSFLKGSQQSVLTQDGQKKRTLQSLTDSISCFPKIKYIINAKSVSASCVPIKLDMHMIKCFTV